jgi:hypothetical protein
VPRRPPPEPYQKYRAPLQAKWRPHILARDAHKCRACGAKEALEVAHITDAVAFVRAAGHHRAVTFSYRWDNLMTLCEGCHAVSHARRWKKEDVERRQRVFEVQESLRKVRGWVSPFAVLPPNLVPPGMAPFRSFHDTMRVSPLVPFPTFTKYAADGGLIFQDEEAKPVQSRLLA